MNALRIRCLIVIVFLCAAEAGAGGQVAIVVNTGPCGCNEQGQSMDVFS